MRANFSNKIWLILSILPLIFIYVACAQKPTIDELSKSNSLDLQNNKNNFHENESINVDNEILNNESPDEDASNCDVIDGSFAIELENKFNRIAKISRACPRDG